MAQEVISISRPAFLWHAVLAWLEQFREQCMTRVTASRHLESKWQVL